jgi:hypothetical protein
MIALYAMFVMYSSQLIYNVSSLEVPLPLTPQNIESAPSNNWLSGFFRIGICNINELLDW